MHSVGIPVDNQGGHVDDENRSSAVHDMVAATHRSSRLSSTGLSDLGASVHRGCATLSPLSTAAKKNDENLISKRQNGQNALPVDYVDEPGSSSRFGLAMYLIGRSPLEWSTT
jgi:hypothetical protein